MGGTRWLADMEKKKHTDGGPSSTSNLCICVSMRIFHCLCHLGASVDSGGHELSENVDTYDLIGLI